MTLLDLSTVEFEYRLYSLTTFLFDIPAAWIGMRNVLG